MNTSHTRRPTGPVRHAREAAPRPVRDTRTARLGTFLLAAIAFLAVIAAGTVVVFAVVFTSITTAGGPECQQTPVGVFDNSCVDVSRVDLRGALL